MIKSALVVLLAVSCSAVAQVKTFQLGMLREDVSKRVGAPEKFWAPEPAKYLHGLVEYQAALGVWARIEDVYSRETAKNLYEARVAYGLDNRQSRLHPRQRLSEVEFVIDRPAPFREILADLSEAGETCAGGCNVYGVTGIGPSYLLVYPVKPTPQQVEIAKLAATDYTDESHFGGWCIAMKLHFDVKGPSADARQPDWNNDKIAEAEFGPASLDFELKESLRREHPELLEMIHSADPELRAIANKVIGPPVELGTWRP